MAGTQPSWLQISDFADALPVAGACGWAGRASLLRRAAAGETRSCPARVTGSHALPRHANADVPSRFPLATDEDNTGARLDSGEERNLGTGVRLATPEEYARWYEAVEANPGNHLAGSTEQARVAATCIRRLGTRVLTHGAQMSADVEHACAVVDAAHSTRLETSSLTSIGNLPRVGRQPTDVFGCTLSFCGDVSDIATEAVDAGGTVPCPGQRDSCRGA
ncbi:hypothetical protein RI054_30g120950 [Pseudoscourfieldia marina]